MKYVYAALLLCIGFTSSAQSVKEAKALYNQGDYAAALKGFEKGIEADPEDGYLHQLAGECYLKINGDRSKAITHLKKTIDTGKYHKSALFLLAEAYAQNYQFDEAIDFYNHYLTSVSKKLSVDVRKRIIDCQTAKELMKFPVPAEFTQLGPSINTEYPDYNPFISTDESVLLFSSRAKRKGAETEFDGFYPADIYQCEMQQDGFTKSALLNNNVNSKFDDLIVGLSHDGNTIIVYHDDLDIYGDLFTCERSGKTFGKKQPIEQVNNLNDLESAATFSPDGKAIVFASDRPEGLGMMDLYIIRELPDGTWSEPQNLGPEVNTPMNEDYPHFSHDGRYLYFSSNGHPGMGGYDLYLTEWNTENNIWTHPKNLGYPVNTPRDNRTISFNSDGTSAYVADWRPDSHGDLDIYRIDFEQRKNLPALVRIEVPTGQRENPFIQGEIKVTDEFDELVGIYRPHPKSGKYVMALNPGKYFLYLDAEGYQPYSELMMISDYYAQAEQNVKVIRLNPAN